MDVLILLRLWTGASLWVGNPKHLLQMIGHSRFVRHAQVDLHKSLFAAHDEFPRSQRLRGSFEWMITDYYSKALLERPFEARGILLTGPTRIGKTTETRWILAELNDGTTLMPVGRQAKFQLLKPVSLTEINVHRQEDLNELNSLCHAYAERAGHDFAEIGAVDFYRRFSRACGNSWGIAAEPMIAVLLIAHDKNLDILSTALFCEAFTER